MGELSALFHKNVTIWKRNKIQLLSEYLIVIAFGLVIGIFRYYSKTVSTPATSYLQYADYITPPFQFNSSNITQSYELLFQGYRQAMLYSRGFSDYPMKNCMYNSNSEIKMGGYIGIISDNPAIVGNLTNFFENTDLTNYYPNTSPFPKFYMNFHVKNFTSMDELQNYVSAEDYGSPDADNPPMNKSICFALNFNSTQKGNWTYSFSYNVSGNPSWYDIMALDQPQVIKFKKDIIGDYHWQNQVNSGLSVMQELIANLIFWTDVDPAMNILSQVAITPTQGYSISTLYSNTSNGDMSFFIIFPLMINFLKLIYMMLNEKENRIAENLRNMGMSLYSHYLSWLIFNSLVLISTTLIWATIAKIVFFKASNFILIWLLMLLPGFTLQSCAFFILGIFQKAKNGIIFGVVMLFVFDLVRTARQAIVNPSETLLKWISLSPTAGASATSSLMVLLESYDDGMSFSLFNTMINSFKYLWFVETQLIMIVSLFVLGIYLDQVWPSEIGIKRSPFFFITDWIPKKQQKADNERGEPLIGKETNVGENFENVETNLASQSAENKTLLIKGLRKVYSNGKVAVEGLDLEMYTDQIFALLGHNGAGKTTTISMISGLIEQTQGSITLLGKDTREEAKANRKILGVCPQTNPIYENLTCKEHLVLYATIKHGKSSTGPAVSEREIDLILQDLDLFDKKNYPASKLSGGQKRKLCVAIAFIGGSKVILLDEPTSGMDTYARRFLWDMLRNYKKDRIIILSTHYMDEADYLGDRIAIMGKGKLITCGSSLFLKKRFGIGYDLTVVKSSVETSSDPIESLIHKYVPSAKKSGDISMEVKFQLPATESARFEGLFKEFEDQKQLYGIQTFGISLTTLEEVFLRVAALEDGNLSVEQNKDKILETIKDEGFELNDIREKNPSKVFLMHFGALFKKRLIYFSRDKRGLVCEMILPIIIILIGMFMTTIQFVKTPVSGVIPLNLLSNESVVWFGYTPGNASDLIPALNNTLTKANYILPGASLSYSVISANTLQDFDNALMNTPNDNRYFSIFVNNYDTVNKIYNYTCFVNTTGPFSINMCINLAENILYQTLTGMPDASITMYSAPLGLTKQVASFQNTATGFIASLLVSIAYAFIPASIIVVIVKERENNVKHQQLVSGVSVLAYWLSNLAVDFLKYLVPATATIIIMFSYNVTVFIGSENIVATVVLFFLFGLTLMTFTYLVSFAFKSPSKAQFVIFLVNYMGGSILMILSFILRLLDSTREIQLNFIEFVLRLLPIYSLSFGLFSMANGHIWQIAFKLQNIPGPWNRYCALWSVIYLALGAVLYFFVILLLEAKGNAIARSVASTNSHAPSYYDEDEDVTRERAEVEKDSNYAVRVVNLMVEYVIYREGCCRKKRPESTKLAVKGVSFGVKKGECFGLLGTNGAGKTSTFKVLSGEILPNYGQAQIAGLNVETEMKAIGALIGYCPQFDALLENLTAKEHLELYAAIKGIPKEMRAKLIESKLQQLNLKQYENVLAGTYSGGNKRKLSVAIALLGNPPIILLDEPSSGMDPEARRFMWSIVSQISTQNKTSSVILTTHSMEEAEALSSKLAIMVEGKIKCIGPVQQLKSKYGQGFEIEVKIKLPTSIEVEKLKRLSGTQEERVTTQEEAIRILENIGVLNAKNEFNPHGRCAHFAQQVA